MDRMAFSVPTGATQDSRGCLQHLDARPRALSLGWRELAHRAARPARISLANRRVLGKTQQTGENSHNDFSILTFSNCRACSQT